MGKEIGLNEAQLTDNQDFLKNKCGADRIYDSRLKHNINKGGRKQ